MTWEIAFVFLILLLALGSFVLEKLPPELTAMGAFTLILGTGTIVPLFGVETSLPDAQMLFRVFANGAPITIAAMFILSAALEKCGLLDRLASLMTGLTRLGYTGFLFVMVLAVAAISAFINNTPVVVVFLPVMLALARKLNVPASKLLIPLSYASIFGGCCTLIGTSTNILASGLLQEAGFQPLGMFELARVGLPLVLVGALYLTFFGRKLLPNREPLSAILGEEERREYLTEAVLPKDSAAAGKTPAEAGLLKTSGLHILQVTREGIPLAGDPRQHKLEEGDRLLLSCRPRGFAHARSLEGFSLAIERELGLDTIGVGEGSIVEGIIGPRSSLIGQTLREASFHQRNQMVPLAIHRRGVNISQRIRRTPLEFGDTLLLMGTDRAREELRRGDDILLLDEPATPAMSQRKKAPLVIGTVIAVVAAASFNLLPIAVATILGVVFLFLSNVLKPKEGYRSIEWSLLFLIWGMLGLGMAMQTTGASQLVADLLVQGVDLWIAEPWKPFALLVALYAVSSIFTELLSNNATVVLMVPIGLGLAVTLGVDPRPFVIAICLASSASFSTPIGYQTNTYVYGVGGYRFRDFLRIGIPMNVLYFLTSIAVIPLFWDW